MRLFNGEKPECIQCEHWNNVAIGTPTKTVIGNLIPQYAEKIVTVQKVEEYCMLGHIKPKKEACKDFKKCEDFKEYK